MHPLGRSAAGHQVAEIATLPPKVLAVSGRATLVCPLDGPNVVPATRPEASAAAHCIRSIRTDSLCFCQSF